jgi:hypothetical protein
VEDDHTAERPRDTWKDVGTRTIAKAMRKLDMIGMAVERRLWHREVADDSVDTITCYADSSPVTGMEFLGMLADVNLKDGSRRRVIMPC